MNFMSTFQFTAPASAADTWGFDLDVLPHPIGFGSVHTYDASVAHSELFNLNNTQLTGATHADKYNTWIGYAQRWRPTYMGVTVYQDGAALTNQGTLQACQRPVHEVKLQGTAGAFTAGALTGGYANNPMVMYQAADRTSFETVSNMPNAYVGRSADGCYMPLIMTNTCQKWHGQHDQVQHVKVAASSTTGYPYPTSDSVNVWPFYDLHTVYQNGSGASGVIAGQFTSKVGSDIWGLICARNLDITTSFTVVIRCGFEIQCQPGTLLSPQLHISPAYDPQALASYFAIRREMKDAFPADFNDWAKIWGVIKRVADVVLPGVSMMGPIGSVIGAAGRGAVSVVDAITNAVSKGQNLEKGRNPMPLAQKERTQDLVKAAALLSAMRAKPVKSQIRGGRPQAPKRK